MKSEGTYTATLVTYNVINSHEKFNACSTIFIGLNVFLGKEGESKIQAEKTSLKFACIYMQVFKMVVESVA